MLLLRMMGGHAKNTERLVAASLNTSSRPAPEKHKSTVTIAAIAVIA